MKHLPLEYLVGCTICASDRLLGDYSDQATHLEAKELKKHYAAAIFDYQQNTGVNLRNEDIEHAITHWLAKTGKSYRIMSSLQVFSQEFLEWQGEMFEVRLEKLDAWLALSAYMDPCWIIATAWVNLLNEGAIGISQAITLTSTIQCPIALPRPRLKDYADNHVHLGGHGHVGLTMTDIVLHHLDSKSKIGSWPHRNEYKQFESDRLSKSNLIPAVIHWSNAAMLEIFGQEDADLSLPDFNQMGMTQAPLCAIPAEISAIKGIAQQLVNAVTHTQLHTANHWLMLCIAMIYQQKHQASEAFEPTVRSCNILRNYMIVAGVGLGQFVEYFGFKERKLSQSNQFANHALQYDANLVLREFRVSPDWVVKDSKKSHVLKPRLLERFAKTTSQANIFDQLHLVIHFIRDCPKGFDVYDRYLESYRKGLYSKAQKIEDFFGYQYWQEFQFSSLSDTGVSEGSLDLRKIIRAFDIAGNENHLPVEVFAPILRLLSSGTFHSHTEISMRMPKPFLTIHCGEDYAHILSGMRAVDEAVTFCRLGEKARLGHALALGVDVTQWSQRQRIAYISQGAHLDNLVWCYHHAIKVANIINQFGAVLKLLEQKIAHWSGLIYGKSTCPHELFKAWKLRRNCPISWKKPELPPEKSKYLTPDKTSDNSENTAEKLWLDYCQPPPLEFDNTFSKRKAIVEIHCTASDMRDLSRTTDYVSSQERELYAAIQDMLITQYDKKGITIEACPTSNIYIGRFQNYSEHPLYRWNSPGKSVV